MCILHILNNIQIKSTLRLTINARKKIDDKKISTSVHLTDKGRSAFEEYRENLRQVAEALW